MKITPQFELAQLELEVARLDLEVVKLKNRQVHQLSIWLLWIAVLSTAYCVAWIDGRVKKLEPPKVESKEAP